MFPMFPEHLSPTVVLATARPLMKNARGLRIVAELRRFRSMFGVSPAICCTIWNSLCSRSLVPRGGRPSHLLWALLFLKVYTIETVNASISGVDEKIFRKWTWKFIKNISFLPVIIWDDRKNGTPLESCSISIDGTDVRIFEPSPFSSKWFSHRFRGPGIRYEIGVSITSGSIVWVNGPFPCGSYADVRIFRETMKGMLDAGEYVVADGGYQDVRCKKTGFTSASTRQFAKVRARHETVNGRMKQFSVLKGRFRHKLSLHSFCFHAVAVITQVVIENETPLFNLE